MKPRPAPGRGHLLLRELLQPEAAGQLVDGADVEADRLEPPRVEADAAAHLERRVGAEGARSRGGHAPRAAIWLMRTSTQRCRVAN